MTAEAVSVGVLALVTSLLVPAVILGSRRWSAWERVALPALVAAPVFVLVHALYGHLVLIDTSVLVTVAIDTALVVTSALFWLPVFGTRHQCSGPGKFLYLFLTLPLLDIVGVYLIIRGHVPAGLSMLVGMVPFGLAAIGVVVHWISQEERFMRRFEAIADRQDPADPATRRRILTDTLAAWGGPAEGPEPSDRPGRTPPAH